MKLVNNNKINFWDYAFMLVMVIIAGRASSFTREFGSLSSIATYLALFLSITSLYRHKIHSTKNLLYALITVYAAIILLCAVNSQFAFGNLYVWTINFLVCFSLCIALGSNFFAAYETVILHLSIIGIVCWLLQIIMPDVVLNTMMKFRFSSSYNNDIDVVNSIVYTTYANISNISGGFFVYIRNCGFAWEPGAFSSFIIFAIFSNILRTNFSLRGNIPLYVFFAALLSTQSTTGGMAFIFILAVWFIINKKYKYLVFVIPLILLVWRMDFIGAKLIDEFETGDDYYGRMTSFMFYFQDFITHPLFGHLGNTSSWLFKEGVADSLHCGIGKMLSYYGLLWAGLFFFCIFKTGKHLNQIYGNSNGLLLFVAFICVMFSYDFWNQPIFMCFWMFPFFTQMNESLD